MIIQINVDRERGTPTARQHKNSAIKLSLSLSLIIIILEARYIDELYSVLTRCWSGTNCIGNKTSLLIVEAYKILSQKVLKRQMYERTRVYNWIGNPEAEQIFFPFSPYIKRFAAFFEILCMCYFTSIYTSISIPAKQNTWIYLHMSIQIVYRACYTTNFTIYICRLGI